MMKSVFFTLFILAASFAQGQNGKLLSKVAIEITPETLGQECFQYTGDSLREAYTYLYDLDLFEITYESDGFVVSGVLLEPKREGKYPTIIFNRGGNRSYARMSVKRIISSSLAEMAARGYVVIASNYRENDEYGGEDVNDVVHLISTLEEVEKADTQRIGMYGWSRGGMMTYLALAQTSRIKTAVIGNAPTDFFGIVADRPAVEEQILALYIPDYWEHRDEELKKRSVIYWPEQLNKGTRMLILCGTQDQRVNPQQAHNIAEKLNELNYDFELRKFETDHSFLSKQEELRTLLFEWFEENL
jgi:dipeptidyl aminopeptidase/acylaminoacyl peptidase